jgi:hypothetical protein
VGLSRICRVCKRATKDNRPECRDCRKVGGHMAAERLRQESRLMSKIAQFGRQHYGMAVGPAISVLSSSNCD